jgi:hypothetical protein
MMRMRSKIAGLLSFAASVAIALTASGQTEITAENLRDEHVVAAINAIAEELYARKSPERFWEPADYGGAVPAGQAGGFTALVLLALLYAGETYQSERLADAITYLQETELGGTYAVGVRANVWALLPPRFEPFLEKDTTWLLEGFSDRVGGWNYQQEPMTTRQDNSIRQYGALGLWEAAKRGVELSRRWSRDRIDDDRGTHDSLHYAGFSSRRGCVDARPGREFPEPSRDRPWDHMDERQFLGSDESRPRHRFLLLLIWRRARRTGGRIQILRRSRLVSRGRS